MTGAVKLTPIKGLIINADYTWNFYGLSSTQHVRNFYDYTAVPGTENYYPLDKPKQRNQKPTMTTTTLRLMLSPNIRWHWPKIAITSSSWWVTTKRKNARNIHYAGRKDLINPDNPAINQATGDMAIDGNMGQWAVNGTFARINYDYQGRYLLELNGRYDGSSKFKKRLSLSVLPIRFTCLARIGREILRKHEDMVGQPETTRLLRFAR